MSLAAAPLMQRKRRQAMQNSHASATSMFVAPLNASQHIKTGAELMAENPYRPWPARITSITDLTATEKLFEFRLIDERIREAFQQAPGQFVEPFHFRRRRSPHFHFLFAV